MGSGFKHSPKAARSGPQESRQHVCLCVYIYILRSGIIIGLCIEFLGLDDMNRFSKSLTFVQFRITTDPRL